MEFQPIVSGNLEAAAFDPQTRTMIVKFRSGTAYRYRQIPPSVWDKFQKTFDGKNGRSAGKFFHAQIRSLESEKVEDE